MENKDKEVIENLAKSLNEKNEGLAKSIETKASKEEVDMIKKENAELKAIVVKQGEEISESKSAKVTQKYDPITETLMKNKDRFEALKGNHVPFDLEIKSTVSSTSIVDSNLLDLTLPGINERPYQEGFLYNEFSVTPVGDFQGNSVNMVNQTSATRAAANIAECGLYPSTSDLTWGIQNVPIEKIGDLIKVCEENLVDFSFIRSQIVNLLTTSVAAKVDSQILLGNGTSPQLKGIDTIATAFAAGPYAAAISSATIFDLILVNKALISAAGFGGQKYNANLCLMNISDYYKLLSVKESTGGWIMPPFATENGKVVAGVKIVPNTLVPANTMYVLDTNQLSILARQGMSVRFADQHDTDWDNDLISIKASQRLALWASSVNYAAVVKVSDIAAAITAINKP